MNFSTFFPLTFVRNLLRYGQNRQIQQRGLRHDHCIPQLQIPHRADAPPTAETVNKNHAANPVNLALPNKPNESLFPIEKPQSTLAIHADSTNKPTETHRPSLPPPEPDASKCNEMHHPSKTRISTR